MLVKHNIVYQAGKKTQPYRTVPFRFEMDGTTKKKKIRNQKNSFYLIKRRQHK
jgi:ACT domain-containing protein